MDPALTSSLRRASREQPKTPNGGNPRPPRATTPEKSEQLNALSASRVKFQQFIAAQIGNGPEAEVLLRESLVKTLQNGGSLRRNESAVTWFYRITCDAITDFYRQRGGARQQVYRRRSDIGATNKAATPLDEWNLAISACFEVILPTLKPRYAELMRRIDLDGESKATVARGMKIKAATLDVVLHRARYCLRRRLEDFFGDSLRQRMARYCSEP